MQNKDFPTLPTAGIEIGTGRSVVTCLLLTWISLSTMIVNRLPFLKSNTAMLAEFDETMQILKLSLTLPRPGLRNFLCFYVYMMTIFLIFLYGALIARAFSALAQLAGFP